jgi:hypothetical protein
MGGPVLRPGDSVHTLSDRCHWVDVTCALSLCLVLAAFDYALSVLQCESFQDMLLLTKIVLEILDSGIGLLDKRHEAIIV